MIAEMMKKMMKRKYHRAESSVVAGKENGNAEENDNLKKKIAD
jgi:hypothetical protein